MNRYLEEHIESRYELSRHYNMDGNTTTVVFHPLDAHTDVHNLQPRPALAYSTVPVRLSCSTSLSLDINLSSI